MNVREYGVNDRDQWTIRLLSGNMGSMTGIVGLLSGNAWSF